MGTPYAAAWESAHAVCARSSVASWERRLLGASGRAACFSADHQRLKRASTAGTARLPVIRDFNAAGFHFGKVGESEIVGRVDSHGCFFDASCVPPDSAPDPASPVFINVSPLWPGHALLTPWVRDALPQVASPGAFELAARVVANMGRDDAFAGFNSLGAWASVNHLHFHMGAAKDVRVGDADTSERVPLLHAPLFLIETMPVWAALAAETPIPAVAGVLGATDDNAARRAVGTIHLARADWPVPALVVIAEPREGDATGAVAGDVRSSVAALAGRAAGALACALANLDIPHNAVFGWAPSRSTKGEEGGVSNASASEPAPQWAPRSNSFCVFVFPRKFQTESLRGAMGVATAELAGYAIVNDRDEYDALTEDSLSSEMGAVAALPGQWSTALASARDAVARTACAPALLSKGAGAAAAQELATRAAVFNDLISFVPFSTGRDISNRVRDDARAAAGCPDSDPSLPELDLTYGETGFTFLSIWLRRIETLYGGLPPRGRGIFVDVGCGTGKPLFAAALLHEWKAVVGVEIVEELLSVAETLRDTWEGGMPTIVKGQKHAVSRVPRDARSVDVVLCLGDIAAAHGTALQGPGLAAGEVVDWAADADVAYACSTCFGVPLAEALRGAAKSMRCGAFFILSNDLDLGDEWELIEKSQDGADTFSWGAGTGHLWRKRRVEG